LEDNGFKKEADFLKEPENTSVLILATKVGLFEIERNYQFIKTDISAIGSGSDFAYGYMAGSNSDYKQRMIRAIKECSKKIVSVGNKTYFQVYKKYDRTK
jgi:ATP-dependent protease HslVU (ClpYQ) peptidase subunit